jgi:outer membrane protein assembly factor BamC
MPSKRSLAVLALLALTTSACSISPDEDSPVVAYEDAESRKPLEVPPDLTQPTRRNGVDVPAEPDGGGAVDSAGAGTATANASASADGRLLPEFDRIRLVRGQQTAWIELAGVEPERVWPQLEGFLQSQGLSVARKEPEIGLIETRWFDRGDRPGEGGISGFISGFFSSEGGATKRHKYQLRVERGDNGTRVFLEHRRVAEVAENQNPKQTDTFEWQPRGGDPAVENEMRQRLLVYLGVESERARGVISDAEAERLLGGDAELTGESDGPTAIRVADSDFGRVFARVGRALERIGATDIDPARNEARYRFRWQPPDDAGDGEAQKLELRLNRDGERIRIIAVDAEGRRRTGPVARALLSELVAAMGGGEGATTEPTPDKPQGGGDGEPASGGDRDDNGDYEDANDDGVPDDVPY